MASRFRLLGVDRSHRVIGGHPLVLPAVNHTPPVLRRLRAVLDGQVVVDATIPVLIDADELRLDIKERNERALRADGAAIHARAEAGELRGLVVLVPEG